VRIACVLDGVRPRVANDVVGKRRVTWAFESPREPDAVWLYPAARAAVT
jgi:hypothetical protein